MPEIPKTQKVFTFKEHGGPEKLVFEDIPVPEPKDHQVIVNIKYSGVCHTDLHALQGDWPLAVKTPLVGGHEGAGIVVKVGSSISDVKVGDRVGIKWLNGTCGSCEYCMASFEPSCQEAELSGYTVDGTFQHYAAANGHHVTKIPDNIPLEEAATIMCAGVTVYRALKEANLSAGQWVVLPGAGGGLGHLAVQYARAMGYRVIGIDTGAEKEKLAKQLGAEHFLDFKKSKDLVGEINKLTNGGAHGTLVLATAQEAYKQAASWSRPRSTLVTVSLPAHAVLGAEIFEVTVKSLRIVGSYVGNRLDAIESLEYVSRGLVKAHYKILPFKDLPKVFNDMSEGKIAGRIVLDLEA